MATSEHCTIGFHAVLDACRGTTFALSHGQVLWEGVWHDFPNQTVDLTDDATNYVEIDYFGNLSVNTSGFTDGANFLYVVVMANGLITSVRD